MPSNMRVQLFGSYSCSDGTSGPMGIAIDPTPDGFAAALGPLSGMGIAAVRETPIEYQGNGWMNDLWIAPGESGWGLNLLGQGNTLFGTLFVYDSTRRAKWYSASELTYVGATNPDSLGKYTGPLYESTGPGFGEATFNQNTVTRRQVGTMTVEFQGSRAANITYTVDGTSVSKQVFAFAMRTESLNGTYVGRYYHPVSHTDQPLDISITDAAGLAMRLNPLNGRNCLFVSQPRGQVGHRVVAAGSYTCETGPGGVWSLDEAEVSAEGFTATLNIDNTLRGHIAGFRKSF